MRTGRIERIGILGGTFDPPHYGHLILAQSCLESLRLDRVIFIPSYLPPHKRMKENRALHRHRMLKLACKGNPSFEVSDIEIKEKRISYSVSTLQKLRSRYGKRAKLFFLIGSDSYNDLDNWKDIERMQRLAQFVAAARPGHPLKRTRRGVRLLRMPQIEISSSLIRRRVRGQNSIRYLVPENVRRFMLKNKMYGV